MDNRHHVLIATPLSSEDIAAIQRVVSQHDISKVTLLEVMPPIPAVFYLLSNAAELEAELLANAKQKLQLLSEKLGLTHAEQIVGLGYRRIKLAKIAKTIGADIVIRNGCSRWLNRLLKSNITTAAMPEKLVNQPANKIRRNKTDRLASSLKLAAGS